MNVTSNVGDDWFNDFQYGNKGAASFIIAYIGLYGLSIICLLGRQLKSTKRQQYELPAYFLKTLWDVPNKNKLYQELADVERLKRIFRGYFADHESCTSIGHDDLQAMVEERAYACALKYQQKLRRLHLSHTDYYIDMVERFSYNDIDEKNSKFTIMTHTSIPHTKFHNMNRDEHENQIWPISVV
ncbi:unnamed protein product [Rotaria magnacalcarata]|uniref:Uncharacterized protein n=1 Tax=Rotaria magnacalcarata TaxID=392030 RepID=A0A816XM32_9BILA|nr:unnamed protein product [Rotaria magnacalcarata]CAF1500433.1 unnamed protein product [Rotaria magnacalcarata]CAF2116285.1 unnamed protein product [Rotaria magnacalcarata]CAF2147885.1 unnamed protein product [Rotaria magnacalcarata]CAF2199448.1 unnamed protein product [Rotaria magnacalcarata]